MSKLKKIYHERRTKVFKKPRSDLPVISLPLTNDYLPGEPIRIDFSNDQRWPKVKKKHDLITFQICREFGPVDEVIDIFLNGKRLPDDQWKVIKGKDGKPDKVKILAKL